MRIGPRRSTRKLAWSGRNEGDELDCNAIHPFPAFPPRDGTPTEFQATVLERVAPSSLAFTARAVTALVPRSSLCAILESAPETLLDAGSAQARAGSGMGYAYSGPAHEGR